MVVAACFFKGVCVTEIGSVVVLVQFLGEGNYRVAIPVEPCYNACRPRVGTCDES